jgi:hypothetical protein
MHVLAERDELKGAARFGFGFVMRVVIPPRGLGAQHTSTEPVLLDDPPGGVVDAQRGGGAGARAED